MGQDYFQIDELEDLLDEMFLKYVNMSLEDNVKAVLLYEQQNHLKKFFNYVTLNSNYVEYSTARQVLLDKVSE